MACPAAAWSNFAKARGQPNLQLGGVLCSSVAAGKPTAAKPAARPLLAGDTHTHTHLRIHNQKKGVSENEAPGPVGAYTTTHNNTPTQKPDRESILLTATFDQVCSFCREETGL